MGEEFTLESLKRSVDKVGELNPIIVAEDGEVLEGKHRLQIKPDWHKKTVSATSRIEKILIRLHAHYRRRVPREETQATILELADQIEKTGVKKEDVSKALTEMLPYSHSYIRELLPYEYKKSEKVEAARLTEHPLKQVPTQPRVVKCSNLNCGMNTLYPNDWQGKPVCGGCYARLVKGEISLEEPTKPKPTVEVPKPVKVEARAYEPAGAWKERMQQPVSRMDEYVREQLSIQGINHRSQEPVCVLEVSPDIIVEDTAIFLDGPVHDKTRDRDWANRKLLRRKGLRVVEIDYDSFTDEQKKQVLEKVKSAI